MFAGWYGESTMAGPSGECMGAVVYAVKAEALEGAVEGRLRFGRVWYGL